MKFSEDDIREICSDIHNQVADKLNDDFSVDNIEYREQYNDTMNALNDIVNGNNRAFKEEICEIVFESYPEDISDYIYKKYLDEILEDEAQDMMLYLEEHCEFNTWDDEDYEDNY